LSSNDKAGEAVANEHHITRSKSHVLSVRYPIWTDEVDALVDASSDLTREPPADLLPFFSGQWLFWWAPPDGPRTTFRYSLGEIVVAHPSEPAIRRMLEMADALDAWVMHDDLTRYELAVDGTVIRRDPTLDEVLRLRGTFISRGGVDGGMNQSDPITPDDWLGFVAGVPDFRIDEEIEAELPSGVKLIRSPSVTVWHGHPSGHGVPFFFDRDLVEVEGADQPTLDFMYDVAAALDARVLDAEGDELM
jgi:hypothetical protein